MPDNLFITVSKDEDRDQVPENIINVEIYFVMIRPLHLMRVITFNLANTITDLFTYAFRPIYICNQTYLPMHSDYLHM